MLGSSVTLIGHNIWGKKRLAYQIDNQKYGTFVLMNFETEEGSGIAGFESYMKLNISVLRAQTIRLKSRPTKEVLEKSIPLDNKDKFQQSIKDEGKPDKTSEDSSANDESAELIEVENMKELDEGEPTPESIDTDTEKE
ncbi:MAG: hypothetical protein CM1200mP10_28490 [Candidatus Neomarinimicrobiota bacterium]|nr:MAG: hypothetical protein CM1200mP10_28490 [Candidatus Neomarinimicrobiota bacterium]